MRLYLVFLSVFSQLIFANCFAQNSSQLSLKEVIDTLALQSSKARIEQLNFQNKLLQYENFKKGFLPSVSFNLSPLGFNRSLKLLQQPGDGSYNYVNDYSNNSSAGINITQKIGSTGGNLTVGSNISYLHQFTSNLNSYNTTPYTLGYSQQLWGGSKSGKLDREIEDKRHEEDLKNFCSKISDIQQEAMTYFMSVFSANLKLDLSKKNQESSDTLLTIGKMRLNNGDFTSFDYNQVELKSTKSTYAYEAALNEYQTAAQKLFTFLGIQGNIYQLKIEAPVFDLPLKLDSSLVNTYVNKNNPYALSERIAKLSADKDLLTAKMGNSLNGNVSLNYGANQYAETLPDAYKKPDSRQSVSVSLQIPIFQWGVNKNKLQVARNSYQVQMIEIDKNRKEFYTGLFEQTNNYNHNVKLWLIAEKTFRLSQEQYKLSIQKFALGKISSYELFAAQEEQSSALQNYYNAVRDVWLGYFNLRKATLYDFASGQELEDIFLNPNTKNSLIGYK